MRLGTPQTQRHRLNLTPGQTGTVLHRSDSQLARRDKLLHPPSTTTKDVLRLLVGTRSALAIRTIRRSGHRTPDGSIMQCSEG
jgi:hypothetical protein